MSQPLHGYESTVIGQDDAGEFLHSLGLDLGLISEALRDGEVGSQEAYRDPSFPPTSPGYFRWAYTVATLRRRHIQSGDWELNNDHNRPLIRSREADRSVTACGGTADVGNPEGFPNVANRKGRATERAYGQLSLISMSQVVTVSVADDAAPAGGHWLLLYYRSHDELRAELSLPKGIENGLVTGWRVRVMLPTHSFNDGLEELPGQNGEDGVNFYLEEA